MVATGSEKTWMRSELIRWYHIGTAGGAEELAMKRQRRSREPSVAVAVAAAMCNRENE